LINYHNLHFLIQEEKILDDPVIYKNPTKGEMYKVQQWATADRSVDYNKGREQNVGGILFDDDVYLFDRNLNMHSHIAHLIGAEYGTAKTHRVYFYYFPKSGGVDISQWEDAKKKELNPRTGEYQSSTGHHDKDREKYIKRILQNPSFRSADEASERHYSKLMQQGRWDELPPEHLKKMEDEARQWRRMREKARAGAGEVFSPQATPRGYGQEFTTPEELKKDKYLADIKERMGKEEALKAKQEAEEKELEKKAAAGDWFAKRELQSLALRRRLPMPSTPKETPEEEAGRRSKIVKQPGTGPRGRQRRR